MARILYAVGVFLILFWIIGFVLKYIVSPLIHLALAIGLAILVYQYFLDRSHRRPI